MALNMKEKHSVCTEFAKEFRNASKKRKGEIIRELVGLTGFHPNYAARKLRMCCLASPPKKQSQARKKKDPRGRKQSYSDNLLPLLERIWMGLDYACGKRLHAGMDDMLDALCRFGELNASSEELAQLRKMSASTIDRMLTPLREKMQLKGRSTTKPGTLLKSQIPIRLGNQWDEDKPGFVEIDLVAHCGDSTRGDYLNTLDVIDIKTCWCETRAVLNKAQKHVFDALKVIRLRLPFPLLGIDSDNGAEFINGELLVYCKQENLVFTRARPCRKNDNCHVEQKNWSVVRQNVGYGRFETLEEVDILNDLYDLLRLHTNFFMPSMKLIEKKRNGSRITKRYEPPKTPFRRVLELDEVDAGVKENLIQIYNTLNPITLRTEIEKRRKELYRCRKASSSTTQNKKEEA